MRRSSVSAGRAWYLAAWAAAVFAIGPALAQIKTDGSLGGPKVQLSDEQQIDIAPDLGRIERSASRSNLFHSFKTFNIRQDQTVTFTGPDDIANVVSRVTGGERSMINGVLRSEVGKADFWFINPAGLTFGPGARVEVPASFHVSTADELRFEDGRVYSATSPESSLTVAAPAAFGFLDDNPAGVLVQTTKPLDLAEGETVSLVGGDLVIRGEGGLRAPGGTVNLVATSGRGAVPVNVPAAQGDGSILIDQGALVDVSGEQSGTVRARARALTLDFADIRADYEGGAANSTGAIDIQVENLTLRNEAGFSASTEGSRRGSAIQVSAGKVVVSSESGILSDVDAAADGNAGPVTVWADHVEISSGALVGSRTFGTGKASPVRIEGRAQPRTQRVIVVGNGLSETTGIVSDAEAGSRGAAGSVKVDAEVVELRSGGQIRSSTFGIRNAGTVKVTARERLLVSRDGTDVLTEIASKAEKSSGNAGTVRVNAGDLAVLDGGLIRSSTLGRGNAGSVNVNARTVMLAGGGQIGSTNQRGSGRGGTVKVDATGSIHISGQDRLEFAVEGLPSGIASPFPPSGVFASSETGAVADAGDVMVSAPIIILADRGEIASESFGRGAAGKITVTDVERLELTDAEITTQAPTGGGGQIEIQAGNLIDMRENSKISSSVAGERGSNAGNIDIDPRFLVMSNSSILAQANEGSGGEIVIGVGTLLRSSPDAIDASAGPAGISGTIAISGAEADVGGDLAPVVAEFLAASQLLAQPCAARSGRPVSSLASGGRGGLMPGPEQPQMAPYLLRREPGSFLPDRADQAPSQASEIASNGSAPSALTIGCP